MRTAEEMLNFISANKVDYLGVMKNTKLDNFKLIERELDFDENVFITFIAMHNYSSLTKADGLHTYAISNKKIYYVKHKLFGGELNHVSLEDVAYITLSNAALMRQISFHNNKSGVLFNIANESIIIDRLNPLINDYFTTLNKTQPNLSMHENNFKQFAPTKGNSLIKIDSKSKLWSITSSPYQKFNFEDLSTFELVVIDGVTKSKSTTKGGASIGRAVVGSIFGPAGMIIGGVTGKKTSKGSSVDFLDSMYITLSLSSDGSVHRLPLLNSKAKINSFKVQAARALAEETIGLLNYIVSNAQNITVETTQNNNASNSIADEIRKFKDLLDDGIITIEEFELKKKQLLDL